eukprot:SAG11_NODE_360_length_10188_cov_25.643671_3_plen_247_part_00
MSSEGFFDVDEVDDYERKVSLILGQPSERKTMRTSLALSTRASFGKYGRDSWREHLESSLLADESSDRIDENGSASPRGIGARIRERKRDAKRKLEISAFADQWFSLHSEDIREIMDSYQCDVDESHDPYELSDELRRRHEERYQRELRRFGHRDVERRFALDARSVLPSHCVHCYDSLRKRELGMICNDCKLGFHARVRCVGAAAPLAIATPIASRQCLAKLATVKSYRSLSIVAALTFSTSSNA